MDLERRAKIRYLAAKDRGLNIPRAARWKKTGASAKLIILPGLDCITLLLKISFAPLLIIIFALLPVIIFALPAGVAFALLLIINLLTVARLCTIPLIPDLLEEVKYRYGIKSWMTLLLRSPIR